MEGNFVPPQGKFKNLMLLDTSITTINKLSNLINYLKIIFWGKI